MESQPSDTVGLLVCTCPRNYLELFNTQSSMATLTANKGKICIFSREKNLTLVYNFLSICIFFPTSTYPVDAGTQSLAVESREAVTTKPSPLVATARTSLEWPRRLHRSL